MRRVKVLLQCIAATAAAATMSCNDEDSDACAGETCSGHGTCEIVESHPTCICEPGFTASGLACLSCDPACGDRECGDDGCGGSCEPGCAEELMCTTDRHCIPHGWIELHAGTYLAGSTETEAGRDAEREGQLEITLTRDFAISATEVTQQDFTELMGYVPSHFSGAGAGDECGAGCPVENVNWHEAAAFCNALSRREGLTPCYRCEGSETFAECELDYEIVSPYACSGYRLPTEAEWEYAARAGTTTATYAGDLTSLECSPGDEALANIAWYCGNARNTTHRVGTRLPNDWGLYDMLGNVAEHCHDGYVADRGTDPVEDPYGEESAAARAFRGGTWTAPPRDTRAASRANSSPDDRHNVLGFRVVRSLE